MQTLNFSIPSLFAFFYLSFVISLFRACTHPLCLCAADGSSKRIDIPKEMTKERIREALVSLSKTNPFEELAAKAQQKQ